MDKIKNEIMLITYADSLGENLKDLKEVLDEHYSDAIGGVHILPFFPSSGDRGFAPMRYDVVDEAFGTIEDVKEISMDKYLMYDFMVNHISRQSEFFKDFQEKKKSKNSLNLKEYLPAVTESFREFSQKHIRTGQCTIHGLRTLIIKPGQMPLKKCISTEISILSAVVRLRSIFPGIS